MEDPEAARQILESMGFDADVAAIALETSGGSLQGALDALMANNSDIESVLDQQPDMNPQLALMYQLSMSTLSTELSVDSSLKLQLHEALYGTDPLVNNSVAQALRVIASSHRRGLISDEQKNKFKAELIEENDPEVVARKVEDIALPYAQYESSGTIEPWTMNYGEFPMPGESEVSAPPLIRQSTRSEQDREYEEAVQHDLERRHQLSQQREAHIHSLLAPAHRLAQLTLLFGARSPVVSPLSIKLRIHFSAGAKREVVLRTDERLEVLLEFVEMTLLRQWMDSLDRNCRALLESVMEGSKSVQAVVEEHETHAIWTLMPTDGRVFTMHTSFPRKEIDLQQQDLTLAEHGIVDSCVVHVRTNA